MKNLLLIDSKDVAKAYTNYFDTLFSKQNLIPIEPMTDLALSSRGY